MAPPVYCSRVEELRLEEQLRNIGMMGCDLKGRIQGARSMCRKEAVSYNYTYHNIEMHKDYVI